ncbi:SDR family NAD(P)-dependent oxidoreductase [Streptacidiphilus anmyonensis]|uniref:SDR family NAD(P)-dependent oxidoreductase n=1 Tax=Streptacidiphilus anmyonensis TaxID=405782 RepID=UPI0005A8BC94|nr:SDR family NAD(P)-dependent oxidoreductase [Streptacidiphilus anmyonensis]
MQIHGARVLLTGASGGIGHTLAHTLARHGAKLVLTGRRTDALQALADSLPSASSHQVLAADLGERSGPEKLVAEAGDVQILVANAALPSSGDVLEYTAEQIDRSLDVNLRAPVLLARLLAPRMVEARQGHLAMIGSISGRVASPGSSLYNAAKFGLRGFTLGLRQDLHGSGVGVSLVQPGFVRDAGMFADTGATPPRGTGTVTPQRVADQTVRAIERNLAEVNVAPLGLRIGSAVGGLFPTLADTVQRRGADPATLHQIADAQRHKR